MKFSVTKEKLLEGLQQVQNVVSTRTTLPILSNVLLQANGSEVHLTTTDLDVGVRLVSRPMAVSRHLSETDQSALQHASIRASPRSITERAWLASSAVRISGGWTRTRGV